MKNRLLMLSTGLVLFSLCGCITTMVGEQVANQAAPPPVENFTFDISSPGTDVATLTVQTRQPSYQAVVEKYAIKVDSGKPLIVSKQSDVTIKLNAGKHTVKLYAASSNPADAEKSSYGTPNTKDVTLAKNQQLTLKYTGPYRLLGSGNVEEIK
jgi:hypothetical protein